MHESHSISAPSKPARHLIDDGRTIFETSDGLAFTIGVAVLEAEITHDHTVYRIQHPNGVDLYHVTCMPSGQLLVTKVS